MAVVSNERTANLKVAVVIPTYSRSEILGRSLEAVRSVDYPAISAVIVIDDGSPEPHASANRQIAEAAGVTFVRQENAGPAAARNLGIARTESELVAFLDDDCAPAPDWLTLLVAPFAADDEGRLGGVGARVLSEPRTTGSGHSARPRSTRPACSRCSPTRPPRTPASRAACSTR